MRPKVFDYIIENDAQREQLRDEMITETCHERWAKLKDLIGDRKNLRRAAEAALSWNRNKGATA